MNLLFLTLGIVLIGCSSTTVYVLNEKEIMSLKKGEGITIPYDGTFYSERAESRVMNAKVIKKNLEGN